MIGREVLAWIVSSKHTKTSQDNTITTTPKKLHVRPSTYYTHNVVNIVFNELDSNKKIRK